MSLLHPCIMFQILSCSWMVFPLVSYVAIVLATCCSIISSIVAALSGSFSVQWPLVIHQFVLLQFFQRENELCVNIIIIISDNTTIVSNIMNWRGVRLRIDLLWALCVRSTIRVEYIHRTSKKEIIEYWTTTRCFGN